MRGLDPMLTVVTAFLLGAEPATLTSRPGVASQLGVHSVEVHYDGRGRVGLARGSLGPLPDDARTFLRDRAAPLGLRGDEALVVLRDERAAEGTRHVRVGRKLGGIPVAFDQLRVHARADGQAYALESETSALEGFTYRPPAFPPQEAVRRASGGYQGPWAEPPESELAILGSRFDGVAEPHLAYRVLIAYPKEPRRLPVSEEVYVDAHSGRVLARLSRVKTAGGTPITISAVNLFDQSVSLNALQFPEGILLEDSVSLDGALLVTMAGNDSYSVYKAQGQPPTVTDPQAVSVAETVSRAIRFDATTFGWNRWDFNQSPTAAGGTLLGVAHVGDHMANAYFTVLGSSSGRYGSVNFGDGDGSYFKDLALCADVVGHELGHGIDQSTAGFLYQNQSGALDEHFADVFGWMFDSTNDTMGERCGGPALNGKVMRDLCDPGNVATVYQPQPAVMSQFQTMPNTEVGDWGGVHVNSGIPNHAACLFRNATDFVTLGKVWFRALSMHLGPTSDFQAMVQATMTSCAELNLTSCDHLANAWAAVGLTPSASGGSCPPNSTQQASQCVCDAGYHVNTARTGCDPDGATTCPAHEHAAGTQCSCDPGYVRNTTGTCVLETSGGACGTHAHSEAGECVCDECYQRTTEGAACTAIAGCVVCRDPLQVNDGSGTCVCEAGTTPSGSTCAPVPGDCGREDDTGRCAGNTLVYCNQTTDSEIIVVADCASNPAKTACGLTDNRYDCVEPSGGCGSVPDNGVCVGNTARYCDSGLVETVDCGENGCRSYLYSGVPVNYCYPCAPHLTYQDAAGGGTCRCAPGSVENSAGDACIDADGPDTSGGSSDDPDSGGKSGCATAGGTSAGWLAFAGWALMLRRRR